MALVVMKFGGTSVATAEGRSAAIGHVKTALDAGGRVIVVVSAMGRKGAPYATDTLLSLLQGEDPLIRDQLISCGETISACVFADELIRRGIPARPFTGESARIETDRVFGAAAVTGMDTEPLTKALDQGLVPVVTGFQGRTADGFAATLGRGGSDTSAVVIGGYLKADAVDIFTDVPGIAKADPRIVPEAAFMKTVSREDMLVLSRWGSGVIHPKAVQAAIDFRVPLLRVRSTFDNGPGTSIGPRSTPGLAGIAVLKDLSEAPEEGRVFTGALPAGSSVITVVRHSETAIAPEAAEAYPAEVRGNTVHIGVPGDLTGEIARKLYEELK